MSARVIAGLAALLAHGGLGAAGASAQFLSPGPLARPHVQLEGDDHCEDCHSSGRRVDNQRCTHCHDDVGNQVRAGRGMHGTEYRGKQCGHCHVEHRGRSHKLIRWPGGSREAFDHGLTGWKLEGKHRQAKCHDCHRQKNRRGAPTFLAARRTCGSCHEDPHDQRLGTRCTQCHDTQGWKNVRLEGFDHDLARFELKGKHRDAECVKCHQDPPKYRDLKFGNCGDCHQDPHEGRFAERCNGCHQEGGWRDVRMARSAHPGLSLGGGHRKVPCVACHDRGRTKAPSRGGRCVSCHGVVHEAPFGKRCQSCHRGIRWLGVKPKLALAAHARTPFPLHGKHLKVPCGNCHRAELPRAERYRGLEFARCNDCHRDAHEGRFASRDGGECGPCHDAHGFAPTRFTVEMHADAAFPLIGKHVAVACKQCHEMPRPRLDWHLSARRCLDCHDNPHGTQFAAELHDGGCAHCHSPLGWTSPNIDHGIWPLTGVHSTVPCGRCHDPTPEDRRAGRGASYRGAPRQCEGCHADVHLGQFRLSEPVRGCDHCHGNTTFRIDPFDHAGLAGYPIEGSHERLACDGCHHMETLRNGEQAIRYRLTYSNCADCHADPHGEQAQ
ncbi:MAG: hypothetical protein OXT09_20640 [Myxococcales bacterium]|nr:hypothetical protein [Myxococcales bacterium]